MAILLAFGQLVVAIEMSSDAFSSATEERKGYEIDIRIITATRARLLHVWAISCPCFEAAGSAWRSSPERGTASLPLTFPASPGRSRHDVGGFLAAGLRSHGPRSRKGVQQVVRVNPVFPDEPQRPSVDGATLPGCLEQNFGCEPSRWPGATGIKPAFEDHPLRRSTARTRG